MKKIPKHPDLHMHSTVSDGTDSPAELAEKVLRSGIDCFSVTDHDSALACDAVKESVKDRIAFLTGIEFSCRDGLGKYHILGYGFDPADPHIRDVIRKGHGYRIYKFLERISFLHDTFGFTFPEERIDELMRLDNPGSPHIAGLMIEFGYANSIDEAIRDYIQKKKFRSEYLKPQEAIEGIAKSGGIPVLAHPVFGSGSQYIRGEELEQRIRYLCDAGLQGAEGFYSKNDASITEEVLHLAEKFGLYVTAGSDYHGKNKTVRIGQTNLDPEIKMPDGMIRFFEEVEDQHGK